MILETQTDADYQDDKKTVLCWFQCFIYFKTFGSHLLHYIEYRTLIICYLKLNSRSSYQNLPGFEEWNVHFEKLSLNYNLEVWKHYQEQSIKLFKSQKQVLFQDKLIKLQGLSLDNIDQFKRLKQKGQGPQINEIKFILSNSQPFQFDTVIQDKFITEFGNEMNSIIKRIQQSQLK